MTTSPPPPSPRLASIDAYRGFVMFLMMAEALHLASVARLHPASSYWAFLASQQTHVEWTGCSLHDLIQPSFSFLVGAALAFSLVSRQRRGESLASAFGHAVRRAVILTALGVFLRSMGRPQTNYTFEDTLSQIGLGYVPLFLIALGPQKVRWAAFWIIIVGYWAAFAAWPLPDASFDYASAGVPPDWVHNATGFAAHWNKNTNLAWAFDGWFLNLFPRAKPFTNNGGGYSTLSFIPTLGTMILGLVAGEWLRREDKAPPWQKGVKLAIVGVALLALGYAAHRLGICPSVKRIWTPSWTLFSGGWCFVLMAVFYDAIDVCGFKSWSFPLRVIGMNSIAAYCMAHLFESFIISSFRTHLGREIFKVGGDAYEPLVRGGMVLLVYWLILFAMYRKGVFLKI